MSAGQDPFDVNAVAHSREARQLAMPVPVTCCDCGKVCRDENGAERTTTDRARREDYCRDCKVLADLDFHERNR